MPGTVKDAGDTGMNKTDVVPAPTELTFQWEATDLTHNPDT